MDNAQPSPRRYELRAIQRRNMHDGTPPKYRKLNTMEMSRLAASATFVGPTTVVQTITLRLMTWNVDGFSTVPRRLAIVSFWWRRKVDIATITESHLFDEDIVTERKTGQDRIMKIQLDHYDVIHWHNRESSAG